MTHELTTVLEITAIFTIFCAIYAPILSWLLPTR